MIGTCIGRYRIKREIGRGGMGVVFEAVHESLGQRAAVKILSQELKQDPQYADYLARFLDEARATTRIQHPSMVKLFDQGELAHGVAYILMEFLDGESLAQRIDRLSPQTLIPALALRICRQLASVVNVAHQNRIVHRDIKPANIILIADPEDLGQDRAKLIDFGLARFLDSPYRRTHHGAIMGTPPYMSPEQCMGSDVDEKSDVYALGVVLYEALCGHPPFDGSASLVIANKLANEPPLLKVVNPRIDAKLSDAVHTLLARSPNKRPTMHQVTAMLRELEQEYGGPLAVSTKSSGESPDAPLRRGLPVSIDPQQTDTTLASGPPVSPTEGRRVVPIVGTLATLCIILTLIWYYLK